MYQFSLFGQFRACKDEEPVDGFDRRKVQELFCYLVTFHSRAHPREQVADLLWEGNSPKSTKKNMRQILWQLHSAFDIEPDAEPVIIVDGDFISLNPAANITVDIIHFEQAANAYRDVSGYELTDIQAGKLHSAVELYQADFLENWYLDWCIHERERFNNQFLMMLDKLICYHEVHHAFETAIHLCNRALREEYIRERTHYQLMRLYYLLGDRTASLRQFERCKSVLEEALGVQPSQSTLQLHDHICNDDAKAVLLNQPYRVHPVTSEGDLLKIMAQVMKLKSVMEDVQWDNMNHLGQDIT